MGVVLEKSFVYRERSRIRVDQVVNFASMAVKLHMPRSLANIIMGYQIAS